MGTIYFLKEHVTIHTGLKLHRCPICGREIRVKSNLYKHMKIHKKPQSNKAVSTEGSSDVTTTTVKESQSPGDVDHHEQHEQPQHQTEHRTIITTNDCDSSQWPGNGTMMVTLDNGTVVSDVTPLVVSFVSAESDGMHSTGSVLELNSEEHAQLINDVAVQSSGVNVTTSSGHGGETTYILSII